MAGKTKYPADFGGTGWPLNSEGYFDLGEVEVGKLTLSVGASRYRNGRLAICLTLVRGPKEDMGQGPSYGKFSTNIEEAALEPGEFVVSHDMEAPLIAALVERVAGRFEDTDEEFRKGVEPGTNLLFVDTGRRVDYGFVRGQPIVRLRDDAVLQHIGEPAVSRR